MIRRRPTGRVGLPRYPARAPSAMVLPESFTPPAASSLHCVYGNDNPLPAEPSACYPDVHRG